MAHLRFVARVNLNSVINLTSKGVLRTKSTSSNDNIIDLSLTMPRPSRRARQQQTMALKKMRKEKWKQGPASTVYLQVVGTGANGTPRALSVFTTHQRYMFNCGEGIQRIANEHKIRLAKLENIFITHKSWDNIGGLPGLTLTLQDIGISNITLHGPPKIENLYSMTHGFLLTKHIKIAKREYSDTPYEDSALKIESVPLFSFKQHAEVTSGGEDDEDDHFEDALDYFSDQGTSSSSSQPRAKKQKMSVREPKGPDISVAYICQLHTLPGHLQPEKCVEFGVPAGPLLSQLKNGNDVTLPDGTVVRSQDVVSPEQPGPVFIIVECPTKNFLDSLLLAPEFFRYQLNSNSRVPDVVVHFTPTEVMNHAKYKEWMKRFPRETHHLTVNDSSPGIANEAAYHIQHKLNLIHSDIFPLLKCNSEEATTTIDNEISNVTVAEPLFQYHLRPHTRHDRTALAIIKPEKYLKEVFDVPESEQAFEDLKKSLRKHKSLDGSDYPQVTFLGTGSSIPSKVRNVSAILIRNSVDQWMLFDCGEGTYGQILRFYGADETENILKNLRAIFISHLHADHHMGMMKILAERRKVLPNRIGKQLYLVAPKQISNWIQRYHNEFSPVMDQFNLITNMSIRNGFRELPVDKYDALLRDLNLKEFNTACVFHCVHAFGITLTHVDGWKLVYSGDTMPCDELVDAGKNCDLLIHEATMEDELVDDARHKTHSTTSQAIEVGRRMNAKFTMLTHFSQRYAKVPIFTDEFHDTVGVAFDNMKVSLKNLVVTPLFNSILRVIFAEDYEDMEEQRERKQRRKENELRKENANKQANLT